MALDLKATLARIGNPSPASLYRWMKNGLFPRPRKTGPRRVAWDEAEVDQWWADRPRTGEDPEGKG
jgi:prophage regulatory protein